MRTIKTYDEQYRNIVNENVAVISENLFDEKMFEDFMQTEFVKMFEDVILNGTVVLLLEGQTWDSVKGWLKNKWGDLKTAVKDFITNIGKIINANVLGKFISAVQAKFKELSKDVLEFFDSIKIAVIKHQLILDNNKPNFKKITEYVMEICKKDKIVGDLKASYNSALQGISNAANSLKTESIFVGSDSLIIDKNLNFVNASLNEFIWNKPKKDFDTSSTEKAPEIENEPEEKDDSANIVTFNVDKTHAEGKNVTTEQLANTGISIFTKLLLKIGVNTPRAQVVLTKLGMILMGIIVGAIITLIVTSGVGVAVTGTAGWAFAGVGFSIVTVIAGLFFAFGVFLLMCWFRKPYPELEDYIEYLEAWFSLYPNGVRPKKKGKIENIRNRDKGEGPREGWSKYDDNRLKRDDTCTLLGKLRSATKKGVAEEDIEKIKSYLSKRGIEPEQYDSERVKCQEKRKSALKGKMVSYKDEETGKWRTGVKMKKGEELPKPKSKLKPTEDETNVRTL